MLNNRCLCSFSLPFHSHLLLISSSPEVPREAAGVTPEKNQGAALLVLSNIQAGGLFNLALPGLGYSRQLISMGAREHSAAPPTPPTLLSHIPSKRRLSRQAKLRHTEVIYRPGLVRMNRLVIILLKGWPDKERTSL